MKKAQVLFMMALGWMASGHANAKAVTEKSLVSSVNFGLNALTAHLSADGEQVEVFIDQAVLGYADNHPTGLDPTSPEAKTLEKLQAAVGATPDQGALVLTFPKSLCNESEVDSNVFSCTRYAFSPPEAKVSLRAGSLSWNGQVVSIGAQTLEVALVNVAVVRLKELTDGTNEEILNYRADLSLRLPHQVGASSSKELNLSKSHLLRLDQL